MTDNTKSWLEMSLIMLRDKSHRHLLQDGHYWFICPAEQVDSVFIHAIELALAEEKRNE